MARVLVVDDAGIMRLNLTKMLQKLDHEVVGQAENCLMGVKMYKQFEPDVVTMDITMPGDNEIKDGIDAVRVIKAEYPNAKIIMVTSHGEQEKVIKAIQCGASNYILKPVSIDKLEEVINKTLSKG